MQEIDVKLVWWNEAHPVEVCRPSSGIRKKCGRGGRTSINNRYKKIERKGCLDDIGGRMMQIEITLLIAMLGGLSACRGGCPDG